MQPPGSLKLQPRCDTQAQPQQHLLTASGQVKREIASHKPFAFRNPLAAPASRAAPLPRGADRHRWAAIPICYRLDDRRKSASALLCLAFRVFNPPAVSFLHCGTAGKQAGESCSEAEVPRTTRSVKGYFRRFRNRSHSMAEPLLDVAAQRRLQALVKKATDKRQFSLDSDVLRDIKGMCRVDEANVRTAFDAISEALKATHAQASLQACACSNIALCHGFQT